MRGIVQALLFTSVALCLYLEHNDWPAIYHHDEPSKVTQLQKNERNLNHPMLLLEAADLARRLAGVPRSDEGGILACGRAVSAFSMALAIGLLSLAGANRLGVFGGFGVGLVSLLCFRFYEVGHYFKEDAPYLLGVAMFLWALTTSKHTAIWLGLSIGVAAASKYAGISLLLVGLLVTVERRTLVFSMLFPILLLHWRLFFMAEPMDVLFGSMTREAMWLVHGHKGIGNALPNFGYFWRLVYELGYHGVVLLGLWVIFRKQLTRADALVLAYTGIYVIVLLSTRKYSERYLLPVSMVALYYIGLQLAQLFRCVPGSRRWLQGGVATLLILAVTIPWYPWLASHRHAFANDSRSGLCQYLATELSEGAVVVADAAAEVAAAQRWRGEKASLVETAEYASRLGSLMELKARGVTHVIICYDTYYRFLVDGHFSTWTLSSVTTSIGWTPSSSVSRRPSGRDGMDSPTC